MSVLLKIISIACLLSMQQNAEQADLESLVGSEIPLFQCASPSGATLTRDGITQLRKLREKANKYYLTCKGDQCIAKQWPEELSPRTAVMPVSLLCPRAISYLQFS